MAEEARPEHDELPEPPDGGWGWVVVAGSFTIMAFTWGQTKAFGLYMLGIQEELGLGAAETALVQGVNVALSFFMGKWICSLQANMKVTAIFSYLSFPFSYLFGIQSFILFCLVDSRLYTVI